MTCPKNFDQDCIGLFRSLEYLSKLEHILRFNFSNDVALSNFLIVSQKNERFLVVTIL